MATKNNACRDEGGYDEASDQTSHDNSPQKPVQYSTAHYDKLLQPRQPQPNGVRSHFAMRKHFRGML